MRVLDRKGAFSSKIRLLDRKCEASNPNREDSHRIHSTEDVDRKVELTEIAHREPSHREPQGCGPRTWFQTEDVTENFANPKMMTEIAASRRDLTKF